MQSKKSGWDGTDRRIQERRSYGRELTNAERELEESKLKDRRYLVDRRRAEIQAAFKR